jgi:hypothetical protein
MPQSIRRTGIRKNTIVVNIAATPLAVERKEMMIEAPRPQFPTRKPAPGFLQSPAETSSVTFAVPSEIAFSKEKPRGGDGGALDGTLCTGGRGKGVPV